jgi:septum formation protein
MNRYEFWLASASPRRKEMLAWSDWFINLSPANIDESLFDYELPQNHVIRLAIEKCKTIKSIPVDDFVIAADTIVVLDNQILGKPVNENHAYQMLTELRSKPHWVMTAIAIHNGRTEEPLIDLCKSEVKMRNYTDTEIYEYIESGDPMDKAGAYAIQNKDFHPVTDFGGCMASVMGMPLCHLERTLRKFSTYQHTDWPRICQFNLKYNCPITDRVIAGEDIG